MRVSLILLLLVSCSQQPKQNYDRTALYHQHVYYQLMGWEDEKPKKVISCTFGGETEAETQYCAFKNFGEEGLLFLEERKEVCEVCSVQKLITVEEWKYCVEVCRP